MKRVGEVRVLIPGVNISRFVGLLARFKCVLMFADFSSARSAQKLSPGSQADASLRPALGPFRGESCACRGPPHFKGTHGHRRSAAGGAAPAGCWSEGDAAGRGCSERWRQWFTVMICHISSLSSVRNNKSCINQVLSQSWSS